MEKGLMSKISRQERGGSELDMGELPESEEVLDWRLFNVDFYSSKFDTTESFKIAE